MRPPSVQNAVYGIGLLKKASVVVLPMNSHHVNRPSALAQEPRSQYSLSYANDRFAVVVGALVLPVKTVHALLEEYVIPIEFLGELSAASPLSLLPTSTLKS